MNRGHWNRYMKAVAGAIFNVCGGLTEFLVFIISIESAKGR